MSITERWIIGLLLVALSGVMGIIHTEVKEKLRDHELQIRINSSRLSVVETETRDQWKEMANMKEEGQRKIDDIRQWLIEHRKATERTH